MRSSSFLALVSAAPSQKFLRNPGLGGSLEGSNSTFSSKKDQL